MGLKQDIASAKTEKEVLELLDKGATFQFASGRTKRCWKATARNVLVSFGAPKKESVKKQND